MASIAAALRLRARETPGRIALITGRTELSYGALDVAAAQVAAWLRARGVGEGDRVMITVGPRESWFAALYLGTHLAGAVAVPVDEKASAETRGSIAEQIAPCLPLEGAALAELKALLDTPDPLAERLEPPAPGLVADILFTSGTTGRPKGVTLTHANIAAAARNINAVLGNGEDDREVVTIPLSHSFGLGRLRCNIVAGGTIILVPGLTFPALTFTALETYQATGLACVPAGAAILMKGGERLAQAGAQLRYMELGSAPMPVQAKRELMRLLPRTRICMHYGLTEASRSAFLDFHRDADRLESLGLPAPNVEIVVRDEQSRPVAPGELGRITVHGGTVMAGYWRDPELTATVVDPDGWLDTRDLGHADQDGYLYLTGRSDDLINVGGRKVSPVMVENAAQRHDAVKEAACVGRTDPAGVLGEVPVLFVVLEEQAALDEDALLAVLTAELEPHAVPREVVVVANLPKTASGKLHRARLRQAP